MARPPTSPLELRKHVGRSIPHNSAALHVTGAALYTDDLPSRFSDVLHAWPVTVPCAHAKVLSIDTRAAETMPGVALVLGAAHVTGVGNVGAARQDEPLFPELVQHYGQAVVWVLADTEQAARNAAEAVQVDYEALPAILTIKDAIAQESFLDKALTIERTEGDRPVAEALSEAPHRLEGQLHVGGQEHFYLEAQASFAYLDESGQVIVHASSQHPTETQLIVARVLGVPSHVVTCQSLRMGGAFGGKEVQANTWAAVAALGAVRTGRPVRVRLDRQRDMTLTGKRHPFLGQYTVGFADDGQILALDVKLYSDGGYSLDLSQPVLARGLFHIDNAYYIPNLKVVGRACKTHKTSQTAFRGFGGPQGMVVVEEIIDRVARATGLAADRVRERNFYTIDQPTHYGMPVTSAARIPQIWNALKVSSDYAARTEAVREFNEAHTNVKKGLAITPLKFGISFTTAFFNQAGALVLIYADGSVQLNHGGTEMGQGLHTKMIQIAADALGVDLESIRMMPTRTDKVPNTSATAASSGTDLNGQAVANACQKLRKRLADVAGVLLGGSGDDVFFRGGKAWLAGEEDRAIAFRDVTSAAYLQRVQLFASGYYRTPNIHFDEDKGRGKPFHYFAYGACVSEVVVDRFTGQYELLRVDILHDVGNSLSPVIDRGQIEGGFIQGLGWLTREELVWNTDGRLATAGASTYKLPTLGDCPEEFNVTLLPQAAEPGVIHGSKAVGEPPLMLAISAREALREAAAAFLSQDVLTKKAAGISLACPTTPEAMFWAIRGQAAPE